MQKTRILTSWKKFLPDFFSNPQSPQQFDRPTFLISKTVRPTGRPFSKCFPTREFSPRMVANIILTQTTAGFSLHLTRTNSVGYKRKEMKIDENLGGKSKKLGLNLSRSSQSRRLYSLQYPL